jgi:hypothetical protein
MLNTGFHSGESISFLFVKSELRTHKQAIYTLLLHIILYPIYSYSLLVRAVVEHFGDDVIKITRYIFHADPSGRAV